MREMEGERYYEKDINLIAVHLTRKGYKNILIFILFIFSMIV